MISLRSFFQRAFNVYPGEVKNALLFAILGFLWTFGATCALKFADALFLIHVGSQSLPQLYTITSCGMILIASILLYAFHHFTSYRIFLTILLIGMGFYSMILVYLYFNTTLDDVWLWYALRIAGSFFFAVLTTCYWTFVDQYHHLQDAKRLFTLFSSTLFLGIASTGLVMSSGILNLSQLMILIITLFLTTFFWVKKISRTVPLVIHEDAEPEGQGTEHSHSFKFLAQSIISSPFTLLLMTSNFLIQLLLVTTEYNYMSTFQNYFDTQPPDTLNGGTDAQLTLFLGHWLAIVSCCDLVFGLFIYSRLVRRFGVTSLLFTTPTLLIGAFTGWSLTTTLLFPIIGLFVVEGTLYVIDDSNFNLLLNAVPSKLKYKIRVIIESFFEPVGTLVSSIMLHFFQNQSKILGLILASVLLLIALGLRSKYLKALFSNLAENAIHFHRNINDWLSRMSFKQQKSAEHRLLAILKSGDDQAQLFACEALLSFKNKSLLNRLLNYATQMSTPAKIKLILLLEKSLFSKEDSVLDTLQSWVEQDIKLQGSVYFYMAKQGLLHPEKAIAALKSDDILLQGAAIIALKTSLADLSAQTVANNRTLAMQYLYSLLESQNEEEICMGLHLLGINGELQDIDILLSFLENPSLKIAQAAAQSIAECEEIDLIRHPPILLACLNRSSDNEIRLSCLKALGKTNDSSLVGSIIESSIYFRPNERRATEFIIHKMGLKTVPTLISLIKNIQLHDRCRTLAGRILGHLSLPLLRKNLSSIIQIEIDRAYFYFTHYRNTPSIESNPDLSLLKKTLLTGYHSVFDFIIQLLGSAEEVEDVELLARSLRSPNPKVRSQAVETLEKTCEPRIFRLLQPLLEELYFDEKIRSYGNKSGESPLSLTELLDKMSESSAQMDRIMAATLQYQLNLPNWRELLRKQMLQQNEIFHCFAYELLDLER